MRILPSTFPVRRDNSFYFFFISPGRLCKFPSHHALAEITALLKVEFAIKRLPDLLESMGFSASVVLPIASVCMSDPSRS
jgi:hypothetical protein